MHPTLPAYFIFNTIYSTSKESLNSFLLLFSPYRSDIWAARFTWAIHIFWHTKYR
jgi:hypothetical protein